MNDRLHDPDSDWVADRLAAERPVPRAGFRAELRHRLLHAGGAAPASRRMRTLIAAYAGSGALLLAMASVSVAGLGPLAA
jgi:hypothetical protein